MKDREWGGKKIVKDYLNFDERISPGRGMERRNEMEVCTRGGGILGKEKRKESDNLEGFSSP